MGSRVSPNGHIYYVDHNTRTTTWQRPLVEAIVQFSYSKTNNDQLDLNVGDVIKDVIKVCMKGEIFIHSYLLNIFVFIG